MSDANDFILWCGGLSKQVTEELLYELFLQAGPLENVKIPVDRNTGNRRDFAFITFKHAESVLYTIKLMGGIRMFGQQLKLQCRPGSSHMQEQNQRNQGSSPQQFTPHGHSNPRQNPMGHPSPHMQQPHPLMMQQGMLMQAGMMQAGMMQAGMMQAGMMSPGTMPPHLSPSFHRSSSAPQIYNGSGNFDQQSPARPDNERRVSRFDDRSGSDSPRHHGDRTSRDEYRGGGGGGSRDHNNRSRDHSGGGGGKSHHRDRSSYHDDRSRSRGDRDNSRDRGGAGGGGNRDGGNDFGDMGYYQGGRGTERDIHKTRQNVLHAQQRSMDHHKMVEQQRGSRNNDGHRQSTRYGRY